MVIFGALGCVSFIDSVLHPESIFTHSYSHSCCHSHPHLAHNIQQIHAIASYMLLSSFHNSSSISSASDHIITSLTLQRQATSPSAVNSASSHSSQRTTRFYYPFIQLLSSAPLLSCTHIRKPRHNPQNQVSLSTESSHLGFNSSYQKTLQSAVNSSCSKVHVATHNLDSSLANN
jgi:hypothetical protein